MKKLNGLVFLFVAVLVSATLALPANCFAEKKPVVLRLVVPTPPNDYPLTTSLGEMTEKFNARTNGEYKMELHAGGALAKLPEYFDAIRIGAVEMGSVAWTIFSFLDPRLGVIEAPFLFNNNEAANYAAKELLPLYDQILQEKFNAKGLGLLAFSASEFVSAKPIHALEDIKGMLVGAVSPVSSVMLKDLGAAPVTIMWSDMYESLQKKVVDGTVFMITAAKVMNLFDICKYSTLFFGTATYQGLSINLDSWKKMPAPVQKILQEEVDANHAWLAEMWPKFLNDSMKEFAEKKGVTFYSLPPEERAKWAEKTSVYREKQLTSYAEFGDKIRKIAAEANAKFPYKVITIQ